MSLAGKRIFITGGSRGIGLAIALRAARDGASIAIAAKTSDPNPKLPGTIHTAAAEIEAAGGKALAIQCDLRDENQIEAAVAQAAEAFGGIDILINNASAINLTRTDQTPATRFDLMFDVNVRGTFLTSQAALPHLRKSAAEGRNPHILNLSPPADCENYKGNISLFIMNGPNIPIASQNFQNSFEVSLGNNNSSIPGFDLASAYLNQEALELKASLFCVEKNLDYFSENALLFDQNNHINTYNIRPNEWLKREQ